jgi:hypothetical protein
MKMDGFLIMEFFRVLKVFCRESEKIKKEKFMVSAGGVLEW